MKINRLYTLSQFVDNIIKYPEIEMDDSTVLTYIESYNDFLKQTLTKDMFINPYEVPEQVFSSKLAIEGANKTYLEAEKKVIFRFEFIEEDKDILLCMFGGFDIRLINNKVEVQMDDWDGCFICETLHGLAEATIGELEINLEI